MPDNGVLFVLTVPNTYKLVTVVPSGSVNNNNNVLSNDMDSILSPPSIDDDFHQHSLINHTHHHNNNSNSNNMNDGDDDDDDDMDVDGEYEMVSQNVEIDVVVFLRALLPSRCGVNNAVFTHDATGEKHTIVFPMMIDYERVLNFLTDFGVGVFFGTISVVPLSVVKIYDPNTIEGLGYKEKDEDVIKVGETMSNRLLLEKVIAQVKANAAMSFDFLVLCIMAALLAGVGLATDNVVVIVASMLVSPLMGPVLGFTFGAVMREKVMVRNGLLTLLIALVLLVVVGFLVGLGFVAWSTSLKWPTPEMENRGIDSGLLIGLTIAIPSGFGVALSVLGDNTASLVGVAISASLLPPAVNTGLFFAYAAVGSKWDLHDSDSPVDRMRMLELGAISFALTILNIVCIFFSAIAMFWVKEVVPFEGKSNFFRPFTSASNYHKRIDAEEAMDLETKLREELQGGHIGAENERVKRGRDANDLMNEMLSMQLPQSIRENKRLMEQLRNLHSVVTMKPVRRDDARTEMDMMKVFQMPLDTDLNTKAKGTQAVQLAFNMGASVFGSNEVVRSKSRELPPVEPEEMDDHLQFQRILRIRHRPFSMERGIKIT